MWSVQALLDFSLIPGINSALEGDTRIEVYRAHEDMSFESQQSSQDEPEEDNA